VLETSLHTLVSPAERQAIVAFLEDSGPTGQAEFFFTTALAAANWGREQADRAQNHAECERLENLIVEAMRLHQRGGPAAARGPITPDDPLDHERRLLRSLRNVLQTQHDHAKATGATQNPRVHDAMKRFDERFGKSGSRKDDRPSASEADQPLTSSWQSVADRHGATYFGMVPVFHITAGGPRGPASNAGLALPPLPSGDEVRPFLGNLVRNFRFTPVALRDCWRALNGGEDPPFAIALRAAMTDGIEHLAATAPLEAVHDALDVLYETPTPQAVHLGPEGHGQQTQAQESLLREVRIGSPGSPETLLRLIPPRSNTPPPTPNPLHPHPHPSS
jgi:hypothetical protein